MSIQKAVIYHNSTCSKSNAALNLLRDHGVDVDIVNYLETPLSKVAITELLAQLGIDAKALIRFAEPVAKELGISPDDNRADDEWINFMAQHPVLIERPIVLIDKKAVIGRPLERVLGLLQHC